MLFETNFKLEKFALKACWENLPKEVQERATGCGLDLMGALILGFRGKQFQAGTKLAKWMNLSGDIEIPGAEGRYNLLGGAILLGHASNSFDIDDGHNIVRGHPGCSFVGGVLTAALQQDVSLKEYLTTLVVCYEGAIRWAIAMQKHYNYLHSTGAYGAFGTALGVGRLLGMDEAQLNNALSIADFHAPMTPVMRAVEYPSMNKDGVPFGSTVGMMAVLETLCGETGKTHLLETPEAEALLDTLGKEYEIMRLYFKPYTCCRWAHQPILACQQLVKKYGFTHSDVKRAVVHTFASASRLNKEAPAETDAAQYNIAYPVASALVFGDVGYLQVCEENLKNPDVLAIMKRLSFVVDADLEARFPEERLAWVEIELADGSVLKSDIFAADGEHTDNISLEWIKNKFRRIMAPILSSEGRESIIAGMTEDLDRPIRDIVRKLNGIIGCTNETA